MQHVPLITIRESLSLEYIKSMDLKNTKIEITADPAFCLLPADTKNVQELWRIYHLPNDQPIIAIAPSQSLTEYGRTSYSNHFEALEKLIKFLTNELKYHVILIPHCLGPFTIADDRIICDMLYRKLGFPENVTVVSLDHSAEEIRGIIAKCDLLIAERMHAAIAGLSQAVPTLVVGYSVKAEGIIGDIFGFDKAEDYLIPITKLSEETLREHAENILEKRQQRLFPFVTLGLCVKNDETTITKTLDSILSLDYPHDYVEIVVVDGCSKDRTRDIINKRLKTSEFKWKMLSDDGQGLGYARQLVIIESVSGKYVIWIDGDHIVPKDYAKKHVEFMERHPSLAGAEAPMLVSKRNVAEKLESYFWYFSCKNRAKRCFGLKSLGSAGSIYRIQAIKDVGGYDANIKGASEDDDLTRRLVDFGWKLSMNPNTFYGHLMVTSWISIWRRYFWYGYGDHYLNHKYPDSIRIAPYLPPRSTISGFRIGIMWYKLTKDLICLLEPIHKTWRCIAWLFGYLKAHLREYGHKK